MSQRSHDWHSQSPQSIDDAVNTAVAYITSTPGATEADGLDLLSKLLSAPHGGGPKTPEGKTRSAQNSLRHGLAAARFKSFKLLPGEDAREYAELCAELRGQFRPRSTAEAHKIDDMAQAWWLQRRARNLETSALEEGNEKGFALYLRYETTQRRGYQMAYKDFQDMQKARLSLQSSPDTTPIVEAGFFQSELTMQRPRNQVQRHQKRRTIPPPLSNPPQAATY
jgi:hypothetical protein